ncbi:MAG: phospholipase [Clostridium sp.]|nr:phospholipase [Clostridium sp.]
MAAGFEKIYSKALGYFIFAINPFKRVVSKAKGTIHKFINFQALEILKNDGYVDAYCFFSDYIEEINKGVVWADLDIKSVNHFYNPDKKRGLYGNSNALTLATDYYDKAKEHWHRDMLDVSMFYLGAVVHLIQDMTVPHHANIRLLDSHRQYEKYIRRMYLDMPKFLANEGGYYFSEIEEFITCNARNAIKIYLKFKNVKKRSGKYYSLAKYTLPLAQKTTAGCFLQFYKDVSKRLPRI